ncbi:MAG: M23 family metallopeptidase [Caulobacterales bacterium]
MSRAFQRHRPRFPFARLAIAGISFALLGVGWALTQAEPLEPADATSADALPVDYVPLGGLAVGPPPALGDPLADAPESDTRTLGAPLDYLRVTSSFGLRRHPILGFTRMHQGVDFAAREGAPVLASADGIVTDAGWSGGYGNMVHIRHAGGWATGYAHLSAYGPGVAAGARVLKGEIIGFVGHTGLATGPHLHFEVSFNGVRVDPMSLSAQTLGAPGLAPPSLTATNLAAPAVTAPTLTARAAPAAQPGSSDVILTAGSTALRLRPAQSPAIPHRA